MGGWDPLYRVQESVSLNSFGHQTRPGKGIFFKKITDDWSNIEKYLACHRPDGH